MSSNLDDASRGGREPDGPAAPGYETADINTRGVLGFLAFLFLVLALVLFATWRLFRYFSVAELEPAAASSFADVRQLPSAPELEVNGREDLLETQAEQQQELETYSWEDRKAQIVRIPIERAMDLLLQKGLPVLPLPTEQEAGAGLSVPNSLKSRAGASATSPAGSKGND
jgi:hypothetical protein